MRKELTQQRLKELLHYDQTTGLFVWKIAVANNVRIGNVVGNVRPDGYRRIRLDGANYYANRLVWFYVHGEWPTHTLDHINLNKADNRLSNLRPATMSQNKANIRVHRQNKLGVKGVHRRKRDGKYAAIIRCDGQRKFLGYHDTVDAAQSAYENAARELFGEFARIN